jgi:hypothetical protein
VRPPSIPPPTHPMHVAQLALFAGHRRRRWHAAPVLRRGVRLPGRRVRGRGRRRRRRGRRRPRRRPGRRRRRRYRVVTSPSERRMASLRERLGKLLGFQDWFGWVVALGGGGSALAPAWLQGCRVRNGNHGLPAHGRACGAGLVILVVPRGRECKVESHARLGLAACTLPVPDHLGPPARRKVALQTSCSGGGRGSLRRPDASVAAPTRHGRLCTLSPERATHVYEHLSNSCKAVRLARDQDP